MRKILVLLVVLSLVVFALAGCTGTSKPEDKPSDTTGDTSGDTTGDTVVGEATKMGLGVVTSIKKSKDYSVDAEKKETLAMGQVDSVIAAASFDKDGKVVSVTIDTAQTRVNFDKDMKVTSDKAAEIKTKVERGDDYGMLKASKIGKEWYQQIAELEKWMVGKTVAEIKAMKVKEVDERHKSVPDVPELTSLVTITIENYIAAVEKAYNNAVDVEGIEKLGLGHNVSIKKSKDYEVKNGKETLPVAQVDTVIAATAFDAQGKVVRTIIDTAQTRVQFSADGKVTSDKTAEIKTKFERGDDYGMLKASKIGKEWYQQIAELEKWMVGKTVDEIKAMKVKEVDASHTSVPDVPELTSLVTITVEKYIAAVEESYVNAR
jgi:roadblock/LC7 domain-containing protein